MNNNYTYIGCVLDRSGSMREAGKIEEARNGFNNFIEEQRKLEGKADIKVTIFDNQIQTLYQGNINSSPVLNVSNFSPGGMTAYYDALGKTIDDIGNSLRNMREQDRPGKVLILVITDGLENSSKEYSAERIKEMIDTQRNKYSWEFVFMGADEQSIKDANDFGIINTVMYSNDAFGTRSAYETMSAMTAYYRSSGNIDYTDNLGEKKSTADFPDNRNDNSGEG